MRLVPTLTHFVLLATASSASAQIGESRPPVYLAQDADYFHFAESEESLAAYYTVINSFSSGDYWDHWMRFSLDGGITWNFADMGGGFDPFDSPWWGRRTAVSGTDLWLHEQGYADDGDSELERLSLLTQQRYPIKFFSDEAPAALAARKKNVIVVTVPDNARHAHRVWITTNHGSSWRPALTFDVPQASRAYTTDAHAVALEGNDFAVAAAVQDHAGAIGLYAAKSADGWSWNPPVRLDGSLTQESYVARSSSLASSRDNIHVSFQVSRGSDEQWITASSDDGTTWRHWEHHSDNPILDLSVAADPGSDHLIAAWREMTASGRDRLVIAMSSDAGTTFVRSLKFDSPSSHPGQNFWDIQAMIEEGRATVGFRSNFGSPLQTQTHLYQLVSSDHGASFQGPYRLSPHSVAAVTDWRMGGDGLAAVAKASRNLTRYSFGLRYPMIGVKPTGQPGEALLQLEAGITAETGPTYARWAISSSPAGPIPHPDNPSLELDLGDSPQLQHVLNHPAKFSSHLRPDGSASCLIRVPPTLTGTYYVQAWVNQGGIAGQGGSRPSDVLEIQL